MASPPASVEGFFEARTCANVGMAFSGSPRPSSPSPSSLRGGESDAASKVPSSSALQRRADERRARTVSVAEAPGGGELQIARTITPSSSSSRSSTVLAGLKLHAGQLSLLRAKKVFRLPESEAIALDQQKYTQALSHIINRDYYPDLPMLKLLHALLEAERRRDVHAAVQLLRRIRALTPASVVNRQGASGTCCGPSPQYTALGTPGLSSSSSAGEAAREQPTSEERVSCSAPSESALPASATRPADTTESPPRRDAENRRARPAESLPSQAGAAGHEREAERDASLSPAYAEADPRRRRGRQGSALLDPEVKENEEIRWKRRRRGDGRYEDSPGPSVSEAGSPLRLRRGPAADDTPVMSSGVSSHARRRSLTRVGRGDDIIVPQGAGKLHRVRTELRLDAFLSRYTSTDNKSFSELVKLEKIEKEKSQRWIDSTQEEHNARMIEIQKKTVTGEHAGQLAVGFFSSRNNLYYKNCDVVDAHRQPYELNRRSGEINNVNTRYCTSERQRQHALYSRQVEKKQHLAATEEQRKALEASAAETPFSREEREKQEEATIKKASDTAVALPGPVSGYGNVDLALRTNEEPQLPTVTWGELLSSPALAQAASPSTPFLQSSIFEPCPVNSYAGVSGQLANTVNLATFKMPDPLPREKALARLQDRASARVREQQLKRQQLVGAAVGQGSPRCRLAAARAAAVVLGRAGRSGRSGSSIGLAAVRRSTGSASRSSEEVQRILRLATGSRDRDMRGSETASRSRRHGASSVASSGLVRSTDPGDLCLSSRASSPPSTSKPATSESAVSFGANAQREGDDRELLTAGLL